MGKSVECVTPCNIVFPEPPPKDYKHKCSHENCGKVFVKLSRLKMHQNTHLSEKPFKCSFEGCNAAYSQTSHLKRHEATRHSKSGGDYKCEFEGCTTSFETSSSLYYHEKRKHGVKKFRCSFCKEMFSKKFLLKEHEVTHTGKDTFKCRSKNCEATFPSHASLKAHQRIHKKESEKSHKCTKCDDVFDKWSLYMEHKKTHPAVAKVPCPECGKLFSKANLRRHQPVHEDTRDAFCCPHDGCARFYYHIRNLTHHVRCAHEGQGFECKICKKTLSTRQKLESHIKIIHENPPPKKSKPQPAFPRDSILKMMSGTPNFKVKRTGPPKGFKPKQKERRDLLESSEIQSSPSTNHENGKLLPTLSEVLLDKIQQETSRILSFEVL